MSAQLPAPTSGPSVAAYVVVALAVAVVLGIIVFSLGPQLGLHLEPLRRIVGLRPA